MHDHATPPKESAIKRGFIKLITRTHPDEETAHAVLGKARAEREKGQALQAKLEAMVAELPRPRRQLLELKDQLANAEGVIKPAEEAIITAFLQGGFHQLAPTANLILVNERIIPILKAEIEKRTADFNAQLKATIEWGTANGASKEAIAEIRETFTV